jgi:hypothetical protein
MVERILRLIKLDFSVFREIEADEKATAEAAIIVLVTAFLSAAGGALVAEQPLMHFLSTMVSGVLSWIVWSIVTYFIGKSLFKGGGTLPQMLRVLGYASAPRILGALGFIPCFGWLAVFAGWVVSIIAAVMAIKEGLDVELGTAILVIIIAIIPVIIVDGIVNAMFGIAAGIGAGIASIFSGR